MRLKNVLTRIVAIMLIICMFISISPIVNVKTSKAGVEVDANDPNNDGPDVNNENNDPGNTGADVGGEVTDPNSHEPIRVDVEASDGDEGGGGKLDIDRDGFYRSPQDDAGKKTEGYIAIKSAEDLISLRNNIDKNKNYTKGKKFKLLNNIDLKAYCGGSKGDWKPIGTWKSEGHAFYGEFDGLGYTISGLYIGDGTEAEGLFGEIDDGGIIKNLVVEGNVFGTYNVGGIVGVNGAGGLVQNCLYRGNVTATKYVGGVIGFCTGGACRKTYFSGKVTGDDIVGGISGDCGKLDGCIAQGIVMSKNTKAGGIVGETAYPTVNCINYCTVTAGSFAGGIAGFSYECSGNYGDIEKCINRGSIKGNKYIGGIIGQALHKVTDCKNEGSVSGKESFGDIIGSGDASLVTGSVIGKGNKTIIFVMIGVFLVAFACGIIFVKKRKGGNYE